MSQSEATRAIEVVGEADALVERLTEEMHPSTAAMWTTLARRAYIEGRLAGTEWAAAKIGGKA